MGQGHAHSCLFSPYLVMDTTISSPASWNSPSYIPFMFHVNASLSFCPSISISSLIGTRTSGWDAFSWITAGSWSSKLIRRATTQYMQLAHLAYIEGQQCLLEAIPTLQVPDQSFDWLLNASLQACGSQKFITFYYIYHNTFLQIKQGSFPGLHLSWCPRLL